MSLSALVRALGIWVSGERTMKAEKGNWGHFLIAHHHPIPRALLETGCHWLIILRMNSANFRWAVCVPEHVGTGPFSTPKELSVAGWASPWAGMEMTQATSDFRPI